MMRRLFQAHNINALITASGNTVQSFWGGLFSKILAGQDLASIIMKPGASACCVFLCACQAASAVAASAPSLPGFAFRRCWGPCCCARCWRRCAGCWWCQEGGGKEGRVFIRGVCWRRRRRLVRRGRGLVNLCAASVVACRVMRNNPLLSLKNEAPCKEATQWSRVYLWMKHK